MKSATECGCNHSLAVICGVFASGAAALFLAGERCLEIGGRLSDSAWTCEFASGTVSSLWALVTPGTAGLIVLFVGIPVYLAVAAIGRRWIFPYGKRRS